jgi:hypothetical protein
MMAMEDIIEIHEMPHYASGSTMVSLSRALTSKKNEVISRVTTYDPFSLAEKYILVAPYNSSDKHVYGKRY